MGRVRAFCTHAAVIGLSMRVLFSVFCEKPPRLVTIFSWKIYEVLKNREAGFRYVFAWGSLSYRVWNLFGERLKAVLINSFFLRSSLFESVIFIDHCFFRTNCVSDRYDFFFTFYISCQVQNRTSFIFYLYILFLTVIVFVSWSISSVLYNWELRILYNWEKDIRQFCDL